MTELTVAQAAPLEVTPVGLRIVRAPTFEEWERFFTSLWDIRNAVMWTLGDMINYGEDQADWGEKYTQALHHSKYSYGTLRNYAYIARRFDLSRRNDKLSWSHHAVIAALSDAEQQTILALAVEKDMSRDEVRDHLKTLPSHTSSSTNVPDPTLLDIAVSGPKLAGNRLSFAVEDISIAQSFVEAMAGQKTPLRLIVRSNDNGR